MLSSFAITFLFTFIYMVPLIYTGEIFFTTAHNVIVVHYHILLVVYNIWKRHNFLQKFIGTKEEEDISKINSVNVAIGFPVCLVVSSVLEVGFYFLYNRKVCHCMHRPFSSSTQHFSPKNILYTQYVF